MENSEDIIRAILGQIKQPLWENWYIQEHIGSGSYSAVYKIAARRMNRTDISALKIEPIVPDETTLLDEDLRRRSIEYKRSLVDNESTIMYELRNSRYIVAYQDEDIRELYIDGKLEGYYFLIRMEYLECVRDLIKDKKLKLTENNIRRLAHDIGHGIKDAHDRGIIHRDLKPGNLFYSTDGVFKLGDFNISKQTVRSTTFAGTAGYLAPEVYFSKSKKGDYYTAQADIYSFGICLYRFMNDYYMPFEKEMLAEAAVDKRMKGVPLPKPSNASDEFARIILKACAYDRSERYQTIDEMLSDLDALNRKKTAPAAVPDQPVPVQVQQIPPRVMPMPSMQPQPVIQPVMQPQPMMQPVYPMNNPYPAPPVRKSSSGILVWLVVLLSIAVLAVSAIAGYKLYNEHNDGSSGQKTVPISSVELDSNRAVIEIYDDIEITDVVCPDEVRMSDIGKLFGYSYNSVTHAETTVTVTVNSDATEKLYCDAPPDISIYSERDGDEYTITIDASELKGKDKICRLSFYGEETGESAELELEVKNTGPFGKDVVRESSDPSIIEFHEDKTFTVYKTGEVTVSWIYNGEVKYSKKINITK